MEILTLAAIRQLCVVASYLACAAARATDAEAVSYAFESAAKGAEGAGALAGSGSQQLARRISRITRRQLKCIEDTCDRWLTSDLGPRWRSDPNAESMLATLEHVLPRCLPNPDDITSFDIDTTKVVDAALARVAASDLDDMNFSKGGIGYNVLRSLLFGSVSALEQDPEFRQLLQVSALRELLRRNRRAEEVSKQRHNELLNAIKSDREYNWRSALESSSYGYGFKNISVWLSDYGRFVGTWGGSTGRLRLYIDNHGRVSGRYDWQQEEWAGEIYAKFVEKAIFRFVWQWRNVHGEGFFLRLADIEAGAQLSPCLLGGWVFDDDAKDLDSLIAFYVENRLDDLAAGLRKKDYASKASDEIINEIDYVKTILAEAGLAGRLNQVFTPWNFLARIPNDDSDKGGDL